MKYKVLFPTAVLTMLLLSGCGGGQSTVDPVDKSEVMSQEPAISAATSIPQEPVRPEQLRDPVTDPDSLRALVQEGEWSWFDDAVMIGDSVSLKLKNHVTQQRQSFPGYFGSGQFLASGSLGSANALWDVDDKSVHPSFQGEKMRLEESIPLTGAKKVYMMLGINDIAVYGIDGAIENYGKLLDSILASVPDVEFFIQSATPICEGAEVGALNNANLVIYNEKLKAMCEEREIHFVDVAAVLTGEDGYLPRDYCSDPDGMGIHLMDVACEIWLGCLLDDAQRLQGN